MRSYKDVVAVPGPLRRFLPSSFDVIGDIAVLKIPEELQPHREAIGLAILRWNPKIRVAVQDRGVKGERRVRSIEVFAGERRTTTVHTEHGLRYRVDLARAYFSPRLASERQRIADLVLEGEVVADPFAGVGPFAILIAKRRRPKLVHASDVNPAALEISNLQLHTVRASSPTQHHVAFDVTVVRASHRAAPGRSPSASRTSPTTGTPARGRRSARTARRLATRGRRSRHSGRRK